MVLTPEEIKARLQSLNLAPDKFLGQHFLIDDGVLSAMRAKATQLAPELIVEIGPGLGVLTEELIKIAPTIAVERDPVLAKNLLSLLPKETHRGNLTVIGGNILEVLDTNPTWPFKFQSGLYSPMIFAGAMGIDGDAHTWPRVPWTVVANIPYAITSPLIRKLLGCAVPPSDLVLLVQKEVAERICAKPGSAKRGLLTLIVETMGEATTTQTVPRTAFWPVPEVAGAILHIHVAPKYDHATRQAVLRLAAIGFSGKRKQLKNSLASGLGLKPSEVTPSLLGLGIDPTRRSETLNLDEWHAMARFWP